MAGIKIKGHGLTPPLPMNKYRVECRCGAWGTIIGHVGAEARRKARANWHEEHKYKVLLAQGKVEDTNA